MYRVFEAGKRCDDYKIPGWLGQDTFDLKRDAEIYAFLWAYSVSKSEAEKEAPEMETGVDYDYSTFEFPLMMRIEEV